MRLDQDIREIARRICERIATSIEIYHSISEDSLKHLPEAFIASHIFQELGHSLTMTMETNSNRLWHWHCDAKRLNDTTPPPEFRKTVGSTRPDLVIFQGDRSKKSEQTMLCLVELKRFGFEESDTAKIRNWMRFLDCPFGLVATFVSIPQFSKYVADERDKCIQEDDWIEGSIARLDDGLGVSMYQTMARIIRNDIYNDATSPPQRGLDAESNF